MKFNFALWLIACFFSGALAGAILGWWALTVPLVALPIALLWAAFSVETEANNGKDS